MTRGEQVAIGASALIAVAIPAWLLLPASVAPLTPPTALPPMVIPPPGAPLSAIYGRALFGGDAPAAAGEVPTDAPALVGIVGRISSDAVAMVKGADGSSRSLQVGDSVDGWALESLAIDAAFFTRGGQRVRVPLPAGD